MKNDKTSALVMILILAVGTISGVATAQFVMSSDGGNINGSIIACVYGACKDNTFNGGTSGGGGGGGGQPTPTTGKLTVFKKVHCVAGVDCPHASDFIIKISGVTASPNPFPGSETGTTVTLTPGTYTVSEEPPSGFTFTTSFTGDCINESISAGETKTCTIDNTKQEP